MIAISCAIAVFLAGTVLGVLVMLRLGARREGRGQSLAIAPPTRSAAAARRISGLYVRRAKPTVRVEYVTVVRQSGDQCDPKPGTRTPQITGPAPRAIGTGAWPSAKARNE